MIARRYPRTFLAIQVIGGGILVLALFAAIYFLMYLAFGGS